MKTAMIPANGTRVRVWMKFTIEWMNHYNRPVEGVIADSNSWDPPGTFRLFPSGNRMGESVVSLERVESLEILEACPDAQSGERTLQVPSTGQTGIEFFEVKGSKGDIYLVKAEGSTFTCNCVAGGFGRVCKHIREIQEKIKSAD